MSERLPAGISAAALLVPLLVVLLRSGLLAQEQYIVVNVAPEEDLRTSFEQIHEFAERHDSGRVNLGVGAIFSYLDRSREQCTADLIAFLSMAEQCDIPVVVQLDGEQWWRARPDLWNWWDPQRPGFDPHNRSNVEWWGWKPDQALKIAWRNWGTQFRVLPPPNLMSEPYRRACHDEMRALIPVILRWWSRLSDRKKHLLLGIKLGWESSIGVNAYYYPNGNALLDSSVQTDPFAELKGELMPDRGMVAVGYAAVTTARLADSGALQEAHLAEVVRWHLDDLCALAAGLGVPREKLFTHVGGWKEEELLYDAAVNGYSCPGWSFYRHAFDATKDRGVERALRNSDAPFWAAAEWMLMEKSDVESWRGALERTLSIPKCRYVCIYNWNGIKDNTGALDAIGTLLDRRHVRPAAGDPAPGREGVPAEPSR